MKRLRDNEWWTVDYSVEENYFFVVWKKAAELMGDEAFKESLEDFSLLIQDYDEPKGFVADARQAHVIMNEAVQLWHDETIVPRYMAVGLKKIAFVLPDDIFAAVSIEQAMEEEQSQALTVKFFEEPDAARDWICG